MSNLKLDFSRGRIFCLIGKQGSGKSYALKSLIKQCSEDGIFAFGHCWCSTAFTNDYDFLPKESVDDKYSEEALERYINKLREWMENNPDKDLPPSFIIFDDLLGKINMYTGFFTNLVACYRHFNISIFITSQYINKLGTLLREMTDYGFLFKSRFRNTKESLYNAFGQQLKNQEEFNYYLEEATKEKHSCLLYVADKNTVEEAYSSFMAPSDDKPFKLKYTPIKF